MDRSALQSRTVPTPLGPPTMCCIFPIRTDKLRLIDFPPNLLPAFRVAIQTSWDRGIQLEEFYFEKSCYDIKLLGNPWTRSTDGSTCRLTAGIMRFMLAHGWGLELSPRLKVNSRQDSWFFRKIPQETHVVMCSLLFVPFDKIRVIDGSSEVIQAVRTTIVNHWYQGLQGQSVHGAAEEFKLLGRPWTTSEDTRSSAFLMYLLGALKSRGWSLYASLGYYESELDTMDYWILKKPQPSRS